MKKSYSEQFKIRCSAIGQIMASKGEITAKQLDEIERLSKKQATSGITEKQAETLAALIHKRNNPELSQTLKTYCEDWLKEQITGKHIDFANKYTAKGNIVEQDGLDLAADVLEFGMLIKNEEHYENDFMTGTPDAITNGWVIDNKSSYGIKTFPMFAKNIPTDDYRYQLQGYMELTGKKQALLIYTLCNTPYHMIESAFNSYCWLYGHDKDDMEMFEKFQRNMEYDDMPKKLRVKSFELEYDEAIIATIKEKVMLCREYIKTIE